MPPHRFVSHDYEAVFVNILRLQEKLIQFKNETGHLPKTLDEMKCTIKSPTHFGEHCVSPHIEDEWGRKFIYIYPAKYGSLEFDLYSVGINGKDETGKNDDISNWSGFSSRYYNRPLMIEEIVKEIIEVVIFVCFLFCLLSLFVGKRSNS